ncbi:MAG: PEP-CTERM sorting domain-containing protein [Odoribacter sp.]|nr:PEP-CTERM sorting domain-containing protein [Odoribacter sp.]
MCRMKMRSLLMTALAVLLLSVSCEKKKPVIDSVTFEDLPLGSSGFWNGSDGSGGFSSGNIFFINHYNNQYISWSAFAYSNHTDKVTPDFNNQYSAIAGNGANGSEKYGVYYYSGVPDTLKFSIPEKIIQISVCNSTYAYHAVKNGNAFCKKFGGDTGNDPDWFILTLTAIDSNGDPAGVVDINLADFRFTDNSKDYIANAWTDIDLSAFGFIKALKFEMSSSDSGIWGMNNPGYVCIDNITGELDISRD